MAESNGTTNPATPDNSSATAGTEQEKGGSLLTGNTEQVPPAGSDPKPASQDGPAPAPKQRPAWKAQATKELQDDDRLDRFSTLSDLGKSYLELEGKLGRSVEIPGENATAEEKDAYFKRIGRPDKSDDYTFEKPEIEGIRFDEGFEKTFRDEAYNLGLTKQQAAELWKMQTNNVVTQATNMAAARRAELESTKAQIRQVYGENAEHELALTQNFMRTAAEKVAPGICQKIEASGLGNDIELLKLMNHFAHRTAEDSFVRNGTGSAGNPGQFNYDLPQK